MLERTATNFRYLRSFAKCDARKAFAFEERPVFYYFNALWNNYLPNRRFLETTLSDYLESFLESYTNEILTIIKCQISNWFDAFWNCYFSNLRSIIVVKIATKTTFSNMFKSFLESYTSEISTTIKCTIINYLSACWNNYFCNRSIPKTLSSNTF